MVSLILLGQGKQCSFLVFLKSALLVSNTSTMDEVLSNWNRLSLTEDEGERVNLESDSDEVVKEYILAARFLTHRV